MIDAMLLFLALSTAPDGTWRYVVPESGGASASPALVPVGLEDEPPADVRVEVAAIGEGVKYGQLRYGDPDSTRVAFLVDRAGGKQYRLFIDRNRNRVLEEDELVPGGGHEWRTELAILTRDAEGEERLVPRCVLLRLGFTGRTCTFATLGGLEGSCTLDGREHAARRVDADGDGFLTGERDQLWLDLDGDGDWSPLSELFLFAPVVTIAGGRYALRSDRLGEALRVEKIEGLGRIDVDLGEREVRDLHVLLSSRDGVVATVRASGEPVEVPPGEYRLGMVSLWLSDPGGGEDVGFVFSGEGTRWYAVERDATVRIDPVGTPRIGIRYEESPPPRAGEKLTFRPWVTTEDGLLLNIAYHGSAARRGELPGATVRLLDASGKQLRTARSGFA